MGPIEQIMYHLSYGVASQVPVVRAGGGSFVAVLFARYLSSYSVGKAAVDQLVRVAADELGRLNVRVNAVRPGG
jgi:NAD(P)-dependent dehydrogenase (short-subunit alcohol dehydrogenase family)